ncbi:hypothetical protein QTJ16_002822 [Diplocarpon rosae]|uniref:Methyltransferase type 11 domain-containing protein n=1 Tax=Diplocarpon rosae TaxID=946125 RepID=A0AAD9T2F0_9HELO|nr:hypothetical protein QTJ16_002822 [Diplocarpon rosae]
MATPFILDTRAATGFQNASAYDRNRPSYPPEAVEKLLGHLGVAGQQGARIVDLACGTGKFTELLAARDEGFEVVGVEPHDGMRDVLVKKGLENVRVVDGDAGNMPVEEGWGDALVAAQAFHWFASESSLKEIHRVLRPGAKFGMIWNIEDYNAPRSWEPSTPWEQKMKDIVVTLGDGHARFRDLEWKEIFEQQSESTPWQALKDTFTHNFPSFSLPLGEESVQWTVWLGDEDIWARFSTLSQIANLSEERREGFHREVLLALKEHGERNAAGEVALHGITYFAWTTRV